MHALWSIPLAIIIGLLAWILFILRGRDTNRGELGEEFARARKEAADNHAALRREVMQSIETFGNLQKQTAQDSSDLQKERLDAFERQLGKLTETLSSQLEKLRGENNQRLDQMRQTVDEKLQSTLEKRLGESFNQVSRHLEAVHKGLGEMQQLATGVGDLKRVLTNVKARGTWGEVQLGQLLADMLAPDQYDENVAVTPGANERVEFAIRLPGGDDGGVYLPVDAKFPKEDYERLVTASEQGDKAGVEVAIKSLEARVLSQAKGIAEKYIAPPHTTDHAILYLPTEGLYAEITRRQEVVARIQREYRVTIAGPNVFCALLSSFQMGFRTLAIQKRSGEVWKTLGAVQTEFSKFGETLAKVKKKLGEASNHMDSVDRRTRVMQRKLRDVESLPAKDSAGLLGFDDGDADDDDDDERVD